MTKRNHNHNRGHVSIPGELYGRFRALADRTGTSMSQLLEHRLTVFINKAEADARLDA